MSNTTGGFSFLSSGSGDTTGGASHTTGASNSDNSDEFGAVTLGGNFGGNSGGNGDEFDPAIHVSRDKRNADGSFTRKRGRRAGNSANSSGKAKGNSPNLSASIDALAGTLVIVHAGVSSALKVPELVIDENDGQTLAKAIANVLDQFDVTPDPKVQAVVGLIVAAGSIYGPRVYLYNSRKKEERKAKKASNGTGEVLTFPGSPMESFTSFDAPPQ